MPRPVSKTPNRIPPEFRRVHMQTKYYYKIEASLDGAPWQVFSGVVMSKTRHSPERYSNHVLDNITGFGNMPYQFRLMETTCKRYRFICCYDEQCRHKQDKCVQRFISNHTTRKTEIVYTDLPLIKEKEVVCP
jgi:hypothetical protein